MKLLWAILISLTIISQSYAADVITTEGGSTCGTEACVPERSLFSVVLNFVADLILPKTSPIVKASEKYLASLYQSCDVLEGRQEPGKYSDLNHPAPNCKKPVPPPSYFIERQGKGRGKPRISSAYEISTPRNRLDCSGFLGGIFMAAGYKMYPTDNDTIDEASNPEISTEGIRYLGKKDIDCFNNVEFTNEERLAEGDIINWRIGRSQHAVIVSRLGRDPFGVRKLHANQCDSKNINLADFDFDITHSLGLPNTGPVKQNIQAFFARTSMNVATSFLNLGINACLAYHKDKSTSAALRGGAFKVLRHQGESNPKCITSKKPIVNGEDCYKSCNEKAK